jgi:hypothetical protein
MSPVDDSSFRLRECFARWWGWLTGGSRQPPTERDHVSNFIEFLADRRALYTPYFLEYPAHVVESVQQIETAASAALSAISAASKASGPIGEIRGACRLFLGRAEIRHARRAGTAIPGDILFFSVIDLRETLATEAATLAGDFALALPFELAQASSFRADHPRRAGDSGGESY